MLSGILIRSEGGLERASCPKSLKRKELPQCSSLCIRLGIQNNHANATILL